MSPNPQKQVKKVAQELKAIVIMLHTIRHIQKFHHSYLSNPSVVKIVNALQKKYNWYRRHNSYLADGAYKLEAHIHRQIVIWSQYQHGRMFFIEPVSYVMYTLEDFQELLKKYFKDLNFKHVEKLSNLITSNHEMEMRYIKRADIYLGMFKEELHKNIFQVAKMTQEKQ